MDVLRLVNAIEETIAEAPDGFPQYRELLHYMPLLFFAKVYLVLKTAAKKALQWS